ncbi:MAG: chitobiase/beta-hexosaminidase C-terminal domain-containing protein [Clostridiales Family XIII bacterium]|nr:chitobiase/beta-hexosaminidase C-terminal domain-containing protein [Clostridiales Family XIII bacterium]
MLLFAPVGTTYAAQADQPAQQPDQVAAAPADDPAAVDTPADTPVDAPADTPADTPVDTAPVNPDDVGTAPVDDGDQTVIEAPKEEPSGITFYKQYAIQTGNDDAMANATQVDLTSSGEYLHGRYSSSRTYDNYLRFTGVSLPEDAVVTSATITFTLRDKAPTAGSLTFYSETGAGAAFTSQAASYAARTFSGSSAVVETPVLAAGDKFTTTDLSGIVTEAFKADPARTAYVFKIVGGDPTATFVARSYNGSSSLAPVLSIEYVSSKGTFEGTGGGASSDAEEYGTAKAIALEDSMQIGGYWSATLTPPYKEIAAFRFPEVALPQNATVDDAYIEFTTYADGPAGKTANIRARAEVGDKGVYTATAGNITSRTYTDSYVDFTLDSFRTLRQKVRTGNLAPLIAELRAHGWQDGGALAFTLDGDAFIGSVYAGGTAYPAKLVIEYSAGTPSGDYPDPAWAQHLILNEYVLGTEAAAFSTVEIYNDNEFAVRLDDTFKLAGGQAPDEAALTSPSGLYIPAKGYAVQNVAKGSAADAGTVTLYKGAEAISTLSYAAADTGFAPAQGQAYGWYEDKAGGVVALFQAGTAGAANAGGKLYLAIGVTKAAGYYEDPIDVAITVPNPDLTTVRYTTDGKTAGASSGTEYAYGEAIAIGEGATRLAIYASDKQATKTANIDYTIGKTAMGEMEVRSHIAKGDDDAMANATRTYLTSSGAYLHGKYSSSVTYDNYLRFTGVDLPDDAVVYGAYINFTVRDKSTAASTFRVVGETGAAAAFTSAVTSFTSRTFTTASVEKTAPASAVDSIYKMDGLEGLVAEMREADPDRNTYVFKITGLTPEAPFVARSYNGSSAKAPELVIQYYSSGGSFTKAIADYRDDSEEYGTAGAIAINDSMQIGGYWSTSLTAPYKEVAAFRFTGTEIPQDATITDAYIEFTTLTKGPAGRTANIEIRTELGDAAQYKTTAYDITKRTYSSSSITWELPSITAVREKIRTPNLADIIDEARLFGWKSGQALAFSLDGDNYIGDVYYGGTSYPAVLHIEYAFGGAGMYRNIETDPSLVDGVVINEVSTSGTKTNEDDWIELYNPSDSFMLLGPGIRLWRDTQTKGDTFDFTGLAIAPHGYRILYCDGNTEEGPDHISFDLKKTAELFLTQQNPDNPKEVLRVIDSFAYGEQLYDQTTARKPNGTARIVLMAEESYCKSNDSAMEKYDLVFSQDRGLYDSAFTLSLTSKTGATIRYTTDGKTPSRTVGTVYTAPLVIARTCAVRAIAYDDVGTTTPVTMTYVLKSNLANETQVGVRWRYKSTITSQQYADALASLPLLSITSDTVEISHASTADYVQGYFEFMPEEGSSDADFYSPIGVKRFGQASRSQFNSGIAVRFKKDFGAGKAKYEFFSSLEGEPYPLTGTYKKLELHEGQDGPQDIIYGLGYNRYDESVTRRLANQMGFFDSHVRYVHYFYNGMYMGIKTMREDYGPHTFEPYFDVDSDDFTKVSFQDSAFKTGRVEDGDGDTAVLKKVNDVAKTGNFQEFKKYVDVDNMIRNQILFMFIDTEHEMNAVIENNVVYSGGAEGSGVKMMFNVNDSDGAFYNKGDTTATAHSLVGGAGNTWHKWKNEPKSRGGAGEYFGIFSGDSTTATKGNLEFKTMVKDRVLELIGPADDGKLRGAEGAPLSVDNVVKIISEEQQKLMVPYRLDAAFMGDNSHIYQDWVSYGASVRALVPARVSFNLEQWKKYNMTHTLKAVTVTQAAGGVALTNPNSGTTVYYTLNGSDPMGANGATPSQSGGNTAAKAYAGGTITVPEGATLTVRAFTTNNWGPVTTY